MTPVSSPDPSTGARPPEFAAPLAPAVRSGDDPFEATSSRWLERSWRDYLLLMGERFWIILLVFVPVVAAAAYLTYRKPTIYTAVATVEVLRSAPVVMPVQDVVNRDIRSTEDLVTQMRVLESRPIVERVAQRLAGEDLRRFLAPYDQGLRSGPVSPVGILFANRRIAAQRPSLVIIISYNHPDPTIAALVANLFADELIAFQTNARIAESLTAVEDLKSRAEEQRQRVRELELQLQDYKEGNDMVSLEETKDITTPKLKQLATLVEQAAGRLADEELLWDLVRRFRAEGRPLTEIGFIAQQPAVSSLQQQLAAQKIELVRLSTRYRARHPRMIQTVNTLAQTETELTEAIRSVVAKLETDHAAAQQALGTAQAQYAAQEQTAFELDRLAVEYGAVRRELLINEKAYQSILARMNETTMSASIETKNVRVMDRATEPAVPSYPDHTADLGLGLAGGLSLALGLAFFVALLDDRVKSPGDITAATSLPLLGLMPRVRGTKRRAQAGSVRDPRAVEAMHALHAQLRLRPDLRHARVLVVASTRPREGASFLASNLARTFAAAGERTLLLEADLRNPTLHFHHGVPNERGVTDLAARPEIPLAALVQSTDTPKLDLLTAGRATAGATQTLASGAFARLAREARASYDRVIIDAPALGAVSDALLLQPYVDGCLFVMRYGGVSRRAARTAVRRWREGSAPAFGAVLNRVTRFGSGYHFARHDDRSYRRATAPVATGRNGRKHA